MNMNARIVGETYRHDADLAGGGSGPAWDDADLPLGRPVIAEALRSETAALAAIRSRYEDARERIISATEPPSAPHPTVPVVLGPALPRVQRRASSAHAEPAAGRGGQGTFRSLLTRLATALG
jgi:hypothetical protein